MNSCGRVWGYRLMLALSLWIACAATASAQTPGSASDSLKFPLNDKAASIDSKPGSLDLNDPANVKRTVEYDEKEDKFYFVDKVGDQYIRTPTYMTQEEYQRYKADQDERSYWRRRMDANTMFNKKPELPTMYKEGMFDRIFGGTGIQVRPQGNVDVTFGGNWQNIKNPALTQRQQKFGAFNFDLQMNINLLATIGDKMKLNISNNTKATFDFQNMQRVEYTGKEDEIIKKIEAGNTSFPLKSALLSGRQSLFGLKTQLQFGKLWVTTVLSQQKSKQNSLTIQGGAQTQQFNIKADAYEENKNFLLAHYFRDNYNKALKNFPVINSLITINKIEVWIANRTGAVTGVRSILAFMDLGESKPYNTSLIPGAVPLNLPDNSANDLYSRLQQLPNARMQSGYALAMESLGLKQGLDFSTVTARKLNPSEYSFNPQLGYISLNTQPNPDEVIGVAFRYTYNGKVYQVGEFSEDLTPDSTNQRMVFLKLLKGTSNSPKLPIWDLMMKNVYAIGGYGISKESFRLNVLYQDPGGGEKRYLPEGASAGVPLLSVLNLDRLNQQNDPSPDGVFDFVEGITINTQQGKVIFPVLEPFGSDLIPAIGTDPVLQRKYPYQILYDSTKTVALQSQQNNRYIMRGTYKSSSSSEISLGGFNIPQGSVSVTAGGQRLVENQDYQIDYGLGRIKILNTGILNSGIPINVQYEDNATFGFQQQNFTGSRFDYILNPKLTLGGTFMRLTERPFTQKTTIGEDPIRNTNLGLDASYQSEFPALTRALDKLPIYSTTASSFITASGEVAGLFPGHSKVIDGVDPGGTVYIDDFEGTRSSYDLKTPVQNWMLASTPTQAVAKDGSILFPEATLDTRAYNSNRAKLAWYQIEPTLVDPTGGTPGYVKSDPDQHYIRLVQVQDVFPQTSNNTLQNSLATFDLSFYPQERGPYNFDVDNIDPATGKLLNPKQRWGGITRYIDNTDFEQSNVEYIEMWILDPYINNRSLSSGGSLYVNLGDISEDVMKDHNMAYENGITNPKDTTKLVSTIWGYAPSFAMQITRSFDNDPTTRSLQDVGFDLMNNDEETQKFQDYLDGLRFKVGATSPAFLQAQKDPANDDYHYFRGDEYDNAYILQRYKRYNNTQGNSPIADNNSSFSSANTTYPESEDLNKDNTLNEAENYYQYRIDLTPNMKVGTNFITDRYDNPGVTLPNGQKEPETWYQFKIPIAEFQNKVGNINDFRSIRFMRMYLSGFEDSVTVRFGRLQLGRNTWRRYMYSLLNPGENIPIDNSSTDFTLLSVSVEENSKRSPIPYVIPPGVTRQQQAVSNGQTIQQNEQSLSLQICNLKDGDARGVFKSLGSTDIRQFDKLRLFVHAEAQVGKSSLQNGDVQMFMRIGSDFTNNYYEYRRPLNITLAGASTQGDIWPSSNEVALTLDDLVSIKTHRNDKSLPTYVPYQETLSDGSVVVVVGQPNIGDAKNVMLGVVNPKKDNTRPSDDGLPKCLEVWFDELRVSGISTTPAYAAAGKTNIQLADLGSVRLSGSTSTAGYGSIDQKVNQRSQNSIYTYDASSNLQLGKLMPKNWGVSLPFFMGYSENVSNPKYNPYDLDQKMENLLAATADPAKRDSLKRAAQDFTSITSFNIANARILGNTKSNSKPKFYSIKNFDFSYSYNKQFKHNSLIESDNMVTQAFGLGYTHNFKSKPIEPFKKFIHSKSKWFSLIKDFNFNPVPVNFSFRNDMNRVMEETQVRVIGDGEYKIAPIYFKNFIWTRTYNMRWELTKSLSFDYSAINRSRIDEPYGRIDTKEKRDSLWNAVKALGRNTQFSQNFNASYNVPLAKTPLTDWTSLKLTYGATYTWTAASRLAENLGNTIANTRQKQINGELNFAQLYNKNRWLKAVNAPVQPKPGGAQMMGGKGGQLPAGKFGGNPAQTVSGPGGNLTDMKASSDALPVDKPADTDKSKKKKKDTYQEQPYVPKVIDLTGYSDAQIDSVKQVQKAEEIAHKKAEAAKKKAAKKAARLARRNSVPEISRAERFGGKLITMLKRVTMNYTESGGTTLPGFMDSAKYLGVSATGSPGLAYAFGYQPQLAWLDQLGKDGKLSRDTLFNAQFSQSYSQNISMTAQVEPISDLRIDFSANRTFSKTFSELYKDTSYKSTPEFNNLNQYHTGTFSQSYIGLKTMFKPSSSRSGTFLEFVNNRVTISSRLGASNPYTNNVQDPNDRAYKKGYTAYSQEVLIPAFLAAYTGQNASSVALLDYDNRNKLNSNPFRFYLPAPNWRITYNGLTKLPGFKMIFNNIVISSAYTGTMSMNSFNSALTYQDLRGVGFPSFIDSNTGNYIPYFQVPNITLTDQLNPMFAVDVALKNNLTTKFEIRRNRVVSLSLIDYQVSETRSFEYVFGLGYRVRGMRLPFPIAGKRVLKNDLNIKVDVGIRDDKTTNTYLSLMNDVVSRGQKVITIAPTIDYLINQSFTIRFFYNRSQTIPYVTTSYPITTTSGGLTLRFMFAQ